MLSAGFFLMVVGLAAGEARRRERRGAFTFDAVAAWLYLAIVGSLVAFSAYAWLMKNAPISTVVTHQYVNPVVAIALGALFLGERLSIAVAIGAALIVGSVFVAVRQEGAARRERAPSPRRARRPRRAASRLTATSRTRCSPAHPQRAPSTPRPALSSTGP